jgi:hypothetical protein
VSARDYGPVDVFDRHRLDGDHDLAIVQLRIGKVAVLRNAPRSIDDSSLHEQDLL